MTIPAGFDDLIVIGDARVLRIDLGEDVSAASAATWRLAKADGVGGFEGATLAERTLGSGIALAPDGQGFDVTWEGAGTADLAPGDYHYALRIVLGGATYTARTGLIRCVAFPPAA